MPRWDCGFTGLAPNNDVVVCANYQTCTTPPVRVDDIDPWEPPICNEGKPMNTMIQMRDWPHRWTS